jgi:hypothetical protein
MVLIINGKMEKLEPKKIINYIEHLLFARHHDRCAL